MAGQSRSHGSDDDEQSNALEPLLTLGGGVENTTVSLGEAAADDEDDYHLSISSKSISQALFSPTSGTNVVSRKNSLTLAAAVDVANVSTTLYCLLVLWCRVNLILFKSPF
jgi:hypothetical protein